MKTLCAICALAMAVMVIGDRATAEETGQKGVAAQVSAPAPSTPPAALKEMQGGICPVMGKPIDKKYSYTYKGTRYYFCCPACPELFKFDPEKYIRKMSPAK